ncbi:MAG TPA: serine hydrolase domain-containing protein, partial [Lacipirellulaceae bacterium]|nr:serine hydrolase domain-containing protein [Lacipirellulaceae bacterium]
GMVTLVCQAGQTVHLGAAGLANVESRVPMKADAIFGVMSMTKPITATALMILVDEGKVGLEDRVDKYIPAFAHAKLKSGEPVTGLTVRSLLTHTSGLTGDQMCVDSLEATAAALAARPFEFQPGTRWEYGPSLNVIGRIIEIASGQAYEAFVSERILKPLKMTDATFHVSPEQRPRLAALYSVEEGARGFKPAARWGDAGEPGCVPNPSGGLFATAAEMARFYNMILAGGALDGVRIVSAEAVREMTSVQTGELVTGFTPGNGWGLGWCVVREPQGLTAMLSPGTFGHGGAYGTQGWVDPERRAVFVLMTQRSNFPNSDGSDVRREFQRLAADALDAE